VFQRDPLVGHQKNLLRDLDARRQKILQRTYNLRLYAQAPRQIQGHAEAQSHAKRMRRIAERMG